MIVQTPAGRALPRTELARTELRHLLAQHGTRRVLLSLLAVLATRPPRHGAPMTAHLRRDIGLPPLSARPHYLRHW